MFAMTIAIALQCMMQYFPDCRLVFEVITGDPYRSVLGN
jgi:hypothetical protein